MGALMIRIGEEFWGTFSYNCNKEPEGKHMVNF